MQKKQLRLLCDKLLALPKETTWAEFKRNNDFHEEIGQNISAIANSAALYEQPCGYICWGVDDATRSLVGTNVKLTQKKVGNQELESWLAMKLSPKIDFRIFEFEHQGKDVVIIVVPPAWHSPIEFDKVAYIRIGSYTNPLRGHPDKQRNLWKILVRASFETEIALSAVECDDAIALIGVSDYFRLTRQPEPQTQSGIVDALVADGLLVDVGGGLFDITNMAGVLFARDINCLPGLARKSLRVIKYEGRDRVSRNYLEQPGRMGYAIGFEGAVRYINSLLPPAKEVIRDVFRIELTAYPNLVIREILANALIHQGFSQSGNGPMVEIFDDRMEITNPGTPLIDVMRFIDAPPQSRNDKLAGFMRRVSLCEERGSGVDRAIEAIEKNHLPPPTFTCSEGQTRVTLFARKDDLSKMDSETRIRACYQHACLMYVSGNRLTNESLRKRFAIAAQNHSIASRIIAETIAAGLIKPYGETRGRRVCYVPAWT